MIDKKTRHEVAIILLKRRKRLGDTQTSAMHLYADLNWLMLHSGQVIDELVDEGVLKDE